MTIEMIDKWVTSFRFNGEKKNEKKICLIGFLIDFIGVLIEVTSVWGVSAVAILDSSVNYVCVWSTKLIIPTLLCCREL